MRSLQCSFGSRSFTDMLSSAVFVGPLQGSGGLSSLLQDLEGRELLDLMHEAIHFQGLHSPVGCSWWLTAFASHRYGWLMNETSDHKHANSFAQCYLRFWVTSLALRPLLEGLALFAEYDVLPLADDQRQSQVSILASHFGGTGLGGKRETELVNSKLRDARTKGFAETKANLLAEELDTSRGGYLVGYLLIKTLWRAAGRNDPYFLVADHFLAHALGILYGDAVLVSIILRPDKTGTLVPQKVGEEAATRAFGALNQFFHDPNLKENRLRSTAESYETRSVDMNSTDHFDGNPLTSFFCTSTEIQEASLLIHARMAEVIAVSKFQPGSVLTDFDQHLIRLWHGREFLRISSSEVDWLRVGSRIVVDSGEVSFDVPSAQLRNDPGQFGKGYIEVAYSLAIRCRLVFLVVDDVAQIINELSSPLREESHSAIERRYICSANLHKADVQLADWLGRTWGTITPHETWERSCNKTNATLTSLYLRFLSQMWSPFSSVIISDSLKSMGLFAIYRNGDKLRRLAMCSVLASMFPDLEDFDRALKAHGLTSRDLDQLNLDFSKHLGFFAIESTPSGVVSAV